MAEFEFFFYEQLNSFRVLIEPYYGLFHALLDEWKMGQQGVPKRQSFSIL